VRLPAPQPQAAARTDGTAASRVPWRRARRPHLAASPCAGRWWQRELFLGGVLFAGSLICGRVSFTRSDAITMRTGRYLVCSDARAPTTAQKYSPSVRAPGIPCVASLHTSHVKKSCCVSRAWPPPCDLVSEFGRNLDGLFTSNLQRPNRLDTRTCPPTWHHNTRPLTLTTTAACRTMPLRLRSRLY
jgi:hypothetical protein